MEDFGRRTVPGYPSEQRLQNDRAQIRASHAAYSNCREVKVPESRHRSMARSAYGVGKSFVCQHPHRLGWGKLPELIPAISRLFGLGSIRKGLQQRER